MNALRMRDRSTGFTLIELLIVVAILGIIAAIAIPNLLRARASANEARAIGDTRTVMSANAVYAATNCGFHAASLDCMVNDPPGNVCIPNYSPNAPTFLSRDVGSTVVPYDRSGYRRDYVGNGAAAAAVNGAICDVASFIDYCYTAAPISTLTGVRNFLGSTAGAIYFSQGTVALGCPAPPGTPTID